MSKKVIIVGGVAGGMSAATRLRRLDESATITVFEKGPHVGYATCGIPFAIGNIIKDDNALISLTPEYFKERFNIDVHVNTEVVSIDRRNEQVSVRVTGELKSRNIAYDKLILSQGAEATRPPIDGEAQSHVVTLHTISDLHAVRRIMAEGEVGDVCIIGGGYIGIEAAENFRKLKLAVSIVEYTPHLMPGVDSDIAEILHAEVRCNGVALFLQSSVQEIKRTHVVLTDGTKVPAQLVIVATGVVARTTLAQQAGLQVGPTGVLVESNLATSDEDIYAIGDMVETMHMITKQPTTVALAGPAARQGRLVADDIAGRTMDYRGNINTTVCQVFSLTIGFAGLSVSALRHVGLNPLWVTVHSPNHARYYPDAHEMTIKMAFEDNSGRILGVQVVGRAGVDKRVDVLATAVQAKMTALDLEHLEVGYAPPYGSAKDPVNIVGFVASNIIRGDCRIIHTEDLSAEILENWQIVDVRTANEFSSAHLLQAINLPIDTLRQQLSRLDKSKPVLVYCYIGYRGYLAYCILRQKGFEVFNLDGGMKVVAEGGLKDLVAPVSTT